MGPTCPAGVGKLISTCPGIDWKEPDRLIEKAGTNGKRGKKNPTLAFFLLSFWACKRTLIIAQGSVEFCTNEKKFHSEPNLDEAVVSSTNPGSGRWSCFTARTEADP